MRNRALSEDANKKAASVWPRPDLVPRALRERVEGLDDRLDTVQVKVKGDFLNLVNGRGEYRSFIPEDVGDRLRRSRLSPTPNATLTDDGFRIESLISGWTWTDDFTRQEDKLVRTTGIRGGAALALELRTVYDPVGSEHPSAAPAPGPGNPSVRAAVIRILPPEREYRELLSGSVEIRALVTHPAIRTVKFLLDGTPVRHTRKRPFKARLELADPPREQMLEVRAYDAEGTLAAGERTILNRIATPFGVRITRASGEEVNGSPAVRIAAEISMPRASLLFSLLQYGSEPGRRALVMVTDGADRQDRQRPEDPADFARRLGLPIYFVEMNNPITPIGYSYDGRARITRVTHSQARRRIRLISKQTGGRHFHIDPLTEDPPWTERIARAFDQIEEDLRHQHVLTYYSSLPPGTAIAPKITVTRRGLKLRSAVPLEAIR